MTFMKTSFVCLLLLAYMGVFHFSNKHLPIKSTRIFHCYYFTALGVSIFDLITLYTINNLDTVPAGVNLAVHIIYMLAINLMIYLLVQYELSLLENQVQINKTARTIQRLLFVVTSLLILVLPLGYVEGSYTNYSMGPKVYALYSSVIFYNIVLLYYGIRYTKLLNREKRVAFLASVPIFIVVSIIAITMPETLSVVVYVVLASVGLLMSKENTEKYLDKETGMFNQYALGIVCNEYILTKKNVVASIVSLGETEHVHVTIDWRYYITVMEKLQYFCKKECKSQVYRVGDNGFVLLASSEQMAKKISDEIVEYATELCNSGLAAEYETVSLLECASSDELMSKIIDICINAINKSASFDFLTGVRNRNSFERHLAQLKKDEVDTFYFIADVNNLKETNDVLGHSAGDKLLQSVAKLLRDTAGDKGLVFRQGGDEFAVLWNGNNADDFLQALETNRKAFNKKQHIPVSFSIGYGKILDENGMDNADIMMYENKKKMKASRRR